MLSSEVYANYCVRLSGDPERATGFRPKTTIEEGIAAFVKWYREYYGV